MIERVCERLDKLLLAKFDLAFGHFRETTDEDGQTRIYMTEPDGNAIQYLLNQALGKPRETWEIDATGRTQITVVHRFETPKLLPGKDPAPLPESPAPPDPPIDAE